MSSIGPSGAAQLLQAERPRITLRRSGQPIDAAAMKLPAISPSPAPMAARSGSDWMKSASTRAWPARSEAGGGQDTLRLNEVGPIDHPPIEGKRARIRIGLECRENGAGVRHLRLARRESGVNHRDLAG